MAYCPPRIPVWAIAAAPPTASSRFLVLALGLVLPTSTPSWHALLQLQGRRVA
jgi:hypothetical protein